MNTLLVIFISVVISFVVSFFMMKFQMKMIEKWMEIFFDEETKRMKSFIEDIYNI